MDIQNSEYVKIPNIKQMNMRNLIIDTLANNLTKNDNDNETIALMISKKNFSKYPKQTRSFESILKNILSEKLKPYNIETIQQEVDILEKLKIIEKDLINLQSNISDNNKNQQIEDLKKSIKIFFKK